MIKPRWLPLALLITPVTVLAADSCSMQEQHQSKYEKYMLNDVPSLLEACGLGLSISLPSFDIPSLGDLFCGYSAGDLNDWYQNNYSTSSPANSLATANKNALSQSKARTKPSVGFNSSPQSAPTSVRQSSNNADAIRELKLLAEQKEKNSSANAADKDSQSIKKWEPASLFKNN
jgi:hypothetical protein